MAILFTCANCRQEMLEKLADKFERKVFCAVLVINLNGVNMLLQHYVYQKSFTCSFFISYSEMKGVEGLQKSLANSSNSNNNNYYMI